MIEHVPYPSGLAMLRECARVLKPGGRIRLSTPDLRQFARLLDDGLDGPEQGYRDWAIASYVEPGHPANAVSLFNSMVRNWGHTYIFDEQTLRETLAAVGFAEMQRFAVHQSADPFLGAVDHEARFPAGYLDIESVILEAVKPV
jgi:predicted SAM-dependent methyltransferase